MYTFEIAVLHTVSNFVDEPIVRVFASYADALAFAVGFADGRPIVFHDEEHAHACGRDILATVQVDD